MSIQQVPLPHFHDLAMGEEKRSVTDDCATAAPNAEVKLVARV